MPPTKGKKPSKKTTKKKDEDVLTPPEGLEALPDLGEDPEDGIETFSLPDDVNFSDGDDDFSLDQLAEDMAAIAGTASRSSSAYEEFLPILSAKVEELGAQMEARLKELEATLISKVFSEIGSRVDEVVNHLVKLHETVSALSVSGPAPSPSSTGKKGDPSPEPKPEVTISTAAQVLLRKYGTSMKGQRISFAAFFPAFFSKHGSQLDSALDTQESIIEWVAANGGKVKGDLISLPVG